MKSISKIAAIVQKAFRKRNKLFHQRKTVKSGSTVVAPVVSYDRKDRPVNHIYLDIHGTRDYDHNQRLGRKYIPKGYAPIRGKNNNGKI